MDNLRTHDHQGPARSADGASAPSADMLAGGKRCPRGVRLATRFASILAITLAVAACLARQPAIPGPGEVAERSQPDAEIAFADSKLQDAVRSLAEAQVTAGELAAAQAAEAETREMLLEAVSQCRPSLSDAQRRHIADAIHAEATRHGYDPLFVMAIVEVESTCSPTANGKRGAVGLVQIKPSTARAVAKDLGVRWLGRSTLTQPVLNVRLGLTYLAQLEERFGDPYVAMAAYNMGPARVGRMSKGRAKSARYVKKILARYEGLLVEHAA